MQNRDAPDGPSETALELHCSPRLFLPSAPSSPLCFLGRQARTAAAGSPCLLQPSFTRVTGVSPVNLPQA